MGGRPRRRETTRRPVAQTLITSAPYLTASAPSRGSRGAGGDTVIAALYSLGARRKPVRSQWPPRAPRCCRDRMRGPGRRRLDRVARTGEGFAGATLRMVVKRRPGYGERRRSGGSPLGTVRGTRRPGQRQCRGLAGAGCGAHKAGSGWRAQIDPRRPTDRELGAAALSCVLDQHTASRTRGSRCRESARLERETARSGGLLGAERRPVEGGGKTLLVTARERQVIVSPRSFGRVPGEALSTMQQLRARLLVPPGSPLVTRGS